MGAQAGTFESAISAVDKCGMCSKCSSSAAVISRSYTKAMDEGSADTSHDGLAQAGAKIRGVLSKHRTRFEVGGDKVADIATEARKRQDKLMQAARAGDFKKTVDAVADGADVHFKDLRGMSPLMLVAASNSKGTLDALKFLIESEADVEARDENGWTPLLHGCRNNRQEVVKHLMDSKASTKTRAGDGKTALMLATMEGADGLVMMLVKAGAQVDKKDETGWSVLFYACKDGRRDLVKWLLDHSANAKEKAKDGSTPLMVTGMNGAVKVGKLLLKKGANINAKNQAGNTVLMCSLMERSEDFAKWLLEELADVSIKNEDGQTALDIAEVLDMTAIKNKIELMMRRDIDEGDREED